MKPKNETDIVRRREDGDAQTIVLDRVTTLPNLVRADDGGDLVLFCPAASHVGSETDTDTLRERGRGQPDVKGVKKEPNALVCLVPGRERLEDLSTASRTGEEKVGQLQRPNSPHSLKLTINPS